MSQLLGFTSNTDQRFDRKYQEYEHLLENIKKNVRLFGVFFDWYKHRLHSVLYNKVEKWESNQLNLLQDKILEIKGEILILSYQAISKVNDTGVPRILVENMMHEVAKYKSLNKEIKDMVYGVLQKHEREMKESALLKQEL